MTATRRSRRSRSKRLSDSTRSALVTARTRATTLVVDEIQLPRNISDAELLRRYADSPSPELRDALIERHMPLARSLARRYHSGREPLDDLLQVAAYGLVKAINGFDADRGSPFAAYASPTILGELRRHFRDNVWSLRLPRNLQEACMRIEAATARLSERLGHPPTVEELANELEISVEDVLDGLEAAAARRTASLDAPRSVSGDAGASTVIETLGTIEPGYGKVEDLLASRAVELDPRERRALVLKFNEGMTQSDVGKLLGVSQMQVSRIIRKALWRLLESVRDDGASLAVPRSATRSRTAEAELAA